MIATTQMLQCVDCREANNLVTWVFPSRDFQAWAGSLLLQMQKYKMADRQIKFYSILKQPKKQKKCSLDPGWKVGILGWYSYIQELQRRLLNGIVNEQFFCYFCVASVLNKNCFGGQRFCISAFCSSREPAKSLEIPRRENPGNEDVGLTAIYTQRHEDPVVEWISFSNHDQ